MNQLEQAKRLAWLGFINDYDGAIELHRDLAQHYAQAEDHLEARWESITPGVKNIYLNRVAYLHGNEAALSVHPDANPVKI